MEPVGDHCGSRRTRSDHGDVNSGPIPEVPANLADADCPGEQAKTERYLVYGHRVVGRPQAERSTLYFDKRYSTVNRSNLAHCGACRGL